MRRERRPFPLPKVRTDRAVRGYAPGVPAISTTGSYEGPVAGEIDVIAVEPQRLIRYGVEEPLPERAEVLPHVAAAARARPLGAHRLVGRFVGARHRTDGHVGTGPALRRQPLEHPVGDQSAVRVEGRDHSLGPERRNVCLIDIEGRLHKVRDAKPRKVAFAQVTGARTLDDAVHRLQRPPATQAGSEGDR